MLFAVRLFSFMLAKGLSAPQASIFLVGIFLAALDPDCPGAELFPPC